MGSKGLWTELMCKNESQAYSIFLSSLDRYFQLLADIGADIYDSCIKDFYSRYNPSVYDRHGNLAGINLYDAKKIFYDGNKTHVLLNEYQLLPYGKDDKRTKVFDFVLAGLRGGPLPHVPDFPMEWYTSYPNSYSRYGRLWQSSQIVFQDILKEFIDTGVQDTIYIAVSMIAQKA